MYNIIYNNLVVNITYIYVYKYLFFLLIVFYIKKELFKRNRNKETAYVLKSLVNTIITNVLNKSISFKNILKNDRFTNQLQYISQKALSICDESEIDGKKKIIIIIN